MCGYTVVGEQGVQEGAKHAPLRGPVLRFSVADVLFAYTHHLGSYCKKVQYPIAEGDV
jgi:hypothetical protein